MSRTLVLFHSTHDAIKAERICHREGLPVKAVPVPRDISAECGIALELVGSLAGRVTELLSANGVECRTIEEER